MQDDDFDSDHESFSVRRPVKPRAPPQIVPRSSCQQDPALVALTLELARKGKSLREIDVALAEGGFRNSADRPWPRASDGGVLRRILRSHGVEIPPMQVANARVAASTRPRPAVGEECRRSRRRLSSARDSGATDDFQSGAPPPVPPPVPLTRSPAAAGVVAAVVSPVAPLVVSELEMREHAVMIEEAAEDAAGAEAGARAMSPLGDDEEISAVLRDAHTAAAGAVGTGGDAGATSGVGGEGGGGDDGDGGGGGGDGGDEDGSGGVMSSSGSSGDSFTAPPLRRRQ